MPTEAELLDASRQALEDAAVGLQSAFRVATTGAERDRIEQESNRIIAKLKKMAATDLLAAAAMVGETAAELDAIIATAKTKPLSQALDGAVAALGKLSDARRDIHKQDALPSAITPAPAPSPAQPAPPPVQPAPAGIPQTLTATTFATLEPEYTQFFSACAVRPERASNIDYYLNSIVAGKANYDEAVAGMAIPWYFVGIIHGMEGGFHFGTHLHNGDPLRAPTVHVPTGRPQGSLPPDGRPFTWRESAVDALKFMGFDQVQDWTDAQMLFRFERYNGMGYRPFRLPSPYLWSFSNLYDKGKYVADGKYVATAVSQQCGAGVILKEGKRRGVFV